MDYWSLSLKEALDDVNRVAPKHARVLVLGGPKMIAAQYARPDLQMFYPQDGDAPQKQYDYAVLLNRTHCQDAQTIFTIARRGAVFAYVKYVAPGVQCQ